jgi:membrane protease YdiL (CAAX protease family)
MSLLYVAMAFYIGYLYRSDFLADKSCKPNPKALPGATSAPGGLYAVGVVGALMILAAETFGEIALGISAEQSDVLWFLVFASITAGIVEEVIFRGVLVVESRGRTALIASCVCFSLLFALIHAYLWEFDYPEGIALWKFWKADFNFILTPKAFFTTAILFLNSLWFYALRFGPWNQKRSLFPCMLAHSMSNLGVFAVKFAQGHIVF